MKLQLVYLPFDGLRLVMKVAAARHLMKNNFGKPWFSWDFHIKRVLSSSFFDALKLRKSDAAAVNQDVMPNVGDVVVMSSDCGFESGFEGLIVDVLLKASPVKFGISFGQGAIYYERSFFSVVKPVAVNQVESNLGWYELLLQGGNAVIQVKAINLNYAIGQAKIRLSRGWSVYAVRSMETGVVLRLDSLLVH